MVFTDQQQHVKKLKLILIVHFDGISLQNVLIGFTMIIIVITLGSYLLKYCNYLQFWGTCYFILYFLLHYIFI